MRRLLLLLIIATGCFISIAKSQSPHKEDYFASIKQANEKERPILAHKLYQKTLLHLDSSTTLPVLRSLEKWCIDNDDEKLQTVSLILQGDYYKQHKSEANAFIYLNKALGLATKQKQKEEEAEIYNLRSWLYYHSSKYPQAFEDILKSYALIRNEIGGKNYLYTNRNLYDLGYMYYDFGNFEKSKGYLIEALQYPFASSLDEIGCYNTLGITYESLKNYDSAAYYFKKIIQLAKNINHKAWVGIATGNLGATYYHQSKYSEAIPMLEVDYKASMESKEWNSVGYTLCMWADINIKNHNYAVAAKQLEEVSKLEPFNSNMRLRLSYFLKKSALYSGLKQHEAAYQTLDSARILQIAVSKRNDGITFSQAEQKIAVEQHLAQMSVMKAEESKRLVVRNFIIVIALLLLIICGQLIYRQHLKQKRNKEELEEASNKLNKYLESIREKNLLIEDFRAEIDVLHTMSELNSNSLTVTKEKEEIADKLKKYTILTDDHWNEFRHLFTKVHTDFFAQVKQKYPSLTQSEVRLLALTKLNLSRKEMAEMLGISPDSVKKTRQRIRKKVELPESMDIEDMIAVIDK